MDAGSAHEWKALTGQRKLLCPRLLEDGAVCRSAFVSCAHYSNGTRDHFRHAPEANRHAKTGPETHWHLLAKAAIGQWAKAVCPDCVVEIEGPRMAAGLHGRTPDVRIDRPGRRPIAIEVCW